MVVIAICIGRLGGLCLGPLRRLYYILCNSLGRIYIAIQYRLSGQYVISKYSILASRNNK